MPSARFEAAAAYLSSASSLARVPNSIKLELYGLFKYTTVSSVPTTSRPSIFDMTGRAKWDAWAAAGKKYANAEEAEKRYLEVAKDLGWAETAGQTENQQSAGKGKGKERAQEEPDEEGDIWDPEDDSASRAGAGDGGLGLSVSSMAHGKEASEKSLHGFAVEGDMESIQELLVMIPDLNLDEPDEHGYTPLHLAADRGHFSVVKLILSRHVDRDIKDPDGFTALELAHIAGHEDIVSALSNQHD